MAWHESNCSQQRTFKPYDTVELAQDAIRTILINYANSTRQSTRAAKLMNIGQVEYNFAFIYQLKTLTEVRNKSRVNGTFDGESVCNEFPPPPVWSIEIAPPADFTTTASPFVKLPNSERLIECPKCLGSGRELCNSCIMTGETDINKCTECSLKGAVECALCFTYGKIKTWEEIQASWQSHHDRFVSSPIEVPDDIILEADGVEILKETARGTVEPLRVEEFPDETIVIQSQLAVARGYKNCCRQEQSIILVPIAIVDFEYLDESGKFLLAGTNNNVHFPSYPNDYTLPFCCPCLLLRADKSKQ